MTNRKVTTVAKITRKKSQGYSVILCVVCGQNFSHRENREYPADFFATIG